MNSYSVESTVTRRLRVRSILCAAAICAGSFSTISDAEDLPTGGVINVASDSSAERAPTAEDIAAVLNAQFHIGQQEASKIGEAVAGAARRNTISPFLLLAVIAVESNFNRFAVSGAGAKGLMQVLRSQHQQLAPNTADLTDAVTNVSIGSSILHEYIDASDGDLQHALLRYSGGAKGYSQRVSLRMNLIRTAFSVRAHDFSH
jgi:soluble lytic murein transglycosylase-like protein